MPLTAALVKFVLLPLIPLYRMIDRRVEKLLDETKSLKTLCDNITAEARSRQKNGVAYIQPEEVFQMADDYYGIGSAPKKDHIDVMDLL